MRLHSLRLQAFGPYVAEQVIDFGRLTSSGLFLLEGPTGAGKTTILDAITFALYGGLSAGSSGNDRLHSDFAGPGAEPSVTCEFSLRGVRYRIRRVPEHQRRKKRGEGFTTQASQVHLERAGDRGWASLSSNKAEAGMMITEAIGLDREQFTQVMLLPQGEFARFLHSSDDVRRALLTKLFGTGLFDRITAELDRRRYEACRARERSEREISDAVSAAAEAAGLDADARAELLSLPRADRRTRLKEIAETLAATLAVTEEALEMAAARVATAQAADERAAQQASLMTRLTQAIAELRAHQDSRPEHDHRARLLAAARQAEPVRPLLAALAQAQHAVSAAREALSGLGAGVDEAALAGDPDGAAAAQAAAQAAARAASRAEAAARDAAALQHLASKETMLPGMAAACVGLREAADEACLRAAALEEERRDLATLITSLEGEYQQARSAASGLDAAVTRLETLTAQLQAAQRAQELAGQVDAARAALAAAVDAHQRLVDTHQALMAARLDSMAAELAGTLTDGQPCPVCGATSHPAPAPGHDGMVVAGQVDEAARLRDEAETERARASDEYQQLAQEEAACAARAGGHAAQDLAASVSALERDIAEAEQAATDAGRCEEELSQARAERETLASDLREAAERSAAAGQRAQKAAADADALREELSQAAQDHPSVAARQAALLHAANAGRERATALGALAAALAECAKARGRAADEALARGFTTVETASDAVLGPQQQAALAGQVTSWESSLAALTRAAQAPDLAGLDPERADEVRAAARTAAVALTQARAAEQEARGACEAAKARAERFSQRLDEVIRAEAGHDRLAEATEAVIYLAGLAKGTDGHRRVALTTYVLRRWFGQVIAAANVRLSAMSSGRYELRRTDEGGTRRERAGLTLAVIDRHTGEERSPASLSGGETFYTSLALALGLADVVRAEAGGVDLDTLFIDEGFGCLDAETLDQVMSVIDDLRDRGRAVGIVSHVADLKERVPERLEVRRLPDGSSAVKVVA